MRLHRKKRKRTPKPAFFPIGPRPIHFKLVSPYEPEECAALLMEQSERRKGFFASRLDLLVKVTFRYEKPIYKFEMDQAFSGGLILKSTGTIALHEDGSLITGNVQILSSSYMMMKLFIVTHVIFGGILFFPFGILSVLILRANWLATLRHRRTLFNVIPRTLDAYPVGKRKATAFRRGEFDEPDFLHLLDQQKINELTM